MSATQIIEMLTAFKDSGVRLEISGHIVLTEDLILEGFNNLQIIGIGGAIIEQTNSYNDASPLVLRSCRSVLVSGCRLLGSGTRPDGKPPQTIGARIVSSRYITFNRCEFGPVSTQGTIKHAVSIQDSSHWVWLESNVARRTTAAAFIVGSGIMPHPDDPEAFENHKCTNIHVYQNDFDQVAVAVLVDDATVLTWIAQNRVRMHYSHAIGVEDGSTWFVVTDNICGPGRGAAVSIGHGQTGVWASRGVVANNCAAGCNDSEVIAPPLFVSVAPTSSAFMKGQGSHVLMSSNLDVPED